MSPRCGQKPPIRHNKNARQLIDGFAGRKEAHIPAAGAGFPREEIRVHGNTSTYLVDGKETASYDGRTMEITYPFEPVRFGWNMAAYVAAHRMYGMADEMLGDDHIGILPEFGYGGYFYLPQIRQPYPLRVDTAEKKILNPIDYPRIYASLTRKRQITALRDDLLACCQYDIPIPHHIAGRLQALAIGKLLPRRPRKHEYDSTKDILLSLNSPLSKQQMRQLENKLANYALERHKYDRGIPFFDYACNGNNQMQPSGRMASVREFAAQIGLSLKFQDMMAEEIVMHKLAPPQEKPRR